MAETILVVDDEEPVRRTFREWLEGANLGCDLLSAADAAAALTIANRRSIDLAILDWNLGAGNNGLQLLEDLYLFNPEVVAIMITGYAHQATPLDAMRMGVRDYLDKNQELNRDTFLAAVRKQLEHVRPAKRERQLHRGLAQFRDAVEQILPLIRTAAAVNDPVPFTESVRSVLHFMMRLTQSADAVLIVHAYDAGRAPPETYRAYDVEGRPLSVELQPFAHSLAGAVVTLQEPSVMADLGDDLGSTGPPAGVRLQPFEQGRRNLLAVPLAVAPGINAALELFDKAPPGFTADDRRLAAAASELGAKLIQQALAERETQGTLLEAVQAALETSKRVRETLAEPTPEPVVRENARQSLRRSTVGLADADLTLRAAELLRDIAARHGDKALEECLHVLRSVRTLLDHAAGIDSPEA